MGARQTSSYCRCSHAPHFSPHADELIIETSFAVLSDQRPQCNQLLQCLAEHICPLYTDLLVQIQGDFSSPSIGPFATSYKKLGHTLSIYKFNDIESVLLDSWQIVHPPGAILSLLKNLHSDHVGVDRTMSLTKQLLFWHVMLNDVTTQLTAAELANSTFRLKRRKPSFLALSKKLHFLAKNVLQI